jgi:hypothetical protein
MTYDLAQWLVDELGDSVARLEDQVFGCVPPDRRRERADGGGNSIDWTAFHIARHASLALAVLGASPPLHDADGLGTGAGLSESEPGWATELDGATVEAETIATFMSVRSYLDQVDPTALTGVPDVVPVLEESHLDRGEFGWLYAMWAGKPFAWFVRWPLTGHLTNHVGEMIATRDRLGLSPF